MTFREMFLAEHPIDGEQMLEEARIKAAKGSALFDALETHMEKELLTKLRDEVMKDKELTDTQIFMRDMAKMFCGCSFSGYVRCEGHKDKPIPERWFTRSEVLALLDGLEK